MSPRVRRGLRVHGALDLGLAALYAAVGLWAAGRAAWWNAALGVVVLALAAAGIALFVEPRLGRRIALAAHALLLALCATTIALLVASAAYLHGIYGPIGRGLSVVTVALAALVLEACGLPALVQLRFLLRDDVREALSGRGRAGDPVDARADAS